jgi:eukaryotic-like serine/threonine-protein kinase
MADPTTIDEFLKSLAASGLLPKDGIEKVLADLREAGENPADAASLAEALVRRGVLTDWQAENLLKGKHRGFHLGPYVLLRPLGQGAMGHVFLARHEMMQRRCAIKLLAQKYRTDPDLLARFKVEALAIAALDHPHIVRAYDFNRDTSTGSELYYLVMEYVEGQDLQRIVEKNGVLPYQRAAEFIRQAAIGLEHAHEAGFIHRDIKPGNLLVDNKGVLRILDLGLARLTRGAADDLPIGTSVSGTPDYIAPEQILNRPDLDGRADIYSLGLTFYFLLVGHRPYVKKTMPEILAAHCKEPLPPIDEARPDIPYDLISIIEQMTAKSPERRFRTADDVAAALQTWLQNDACGQSSRLSAFKAAAIRSRQRGVGDSSDAGPPADANVDLELAPLEGSPAPPTVSMQLPTSGTHRSTASDKPAAAAPQPENRVPKGQSAAKPIPASIAPSAALETVASAPVSSLLASLPPEPDFAAAMPGAGLAPARKKADWKQRIVETVQQSPWLWAAIGGIVFVVIVVLLSLVLGLFLPSSGIERAERQPSAHASDAQAGTQTVGWDKIA